ncbi:hypothetical protein D3OALGA1CA_5409 [Olavius algarvensis associated proteobacterium Delta 3]|nr:hypothetical protein D3OALGB2SA_1555 [Olavius algarvensis associated proteobacterium Delta 3]CAB5166281.1 hypothetical protein D3OALGA1CA_5409 [Olavius algarvensis associated proteobacterium Delta 3]
MTTRKIYYVALTVFLVLFAGGTAAGESVPDVDTLIAGIEKRYAGTGFSARFDQESTLKAMDITDTASGGVWFRRPEMMRWEYETPERQVIVSDGVTLWIYRPEDNQVMLGDASAYFGEGRGASFLSDIRLVKKKFDVQLLDDESADTHSVKMTPREKSHDLASVRLTIDKKTFDIVQVITANVYGDETRIRFNTFKYNQDLGASLFFFDIPKGVDVIRLD